MIYAFVVIALALVGLLGYVLHRESRRLDTILSEHRSEVKSLTDQIVLLKVEPQMAAVQAVPMEAITPTHLSLSDDDAVAAYEAERARVLADTKAFIEQHTAEPVS